MCGRCYYCVVEKQPALCTSRKTYGISVSCQEPPHLRGCYSQYIHLLPGAHLIKMDSALDPAVLVAASCSGATAAHTIELCQIEPGDTVLVQGPGPVGLFVAAFAANKGAEVHVMGMAADRQRLELSREFGAKGTMIIEESSVEERRQRMLDVTHGRGANAVIDCTGVPAACKEGIKLTAPNGVYAIPGIATPVGEVPFSLYEDVARKNVRIQGVWVSDTSHLWAAIQLVLSREFPFERLVTHAFALDDAMQGLQAVEKCEAVKAVLKP